MKGVILDADSLGTGDVDLSPVTATLDSFEVFGFTDAADIAARVADADVVLTNKIVLDEKVLQGANIRFVSIMATGTNNVDLATARTLGIPVSNAVGYATPSVVQHTISLMLALSTNLIAYAADVRRGRWQESKVFCRLDYPIAELSGKKLGIVGYGELGHGVANIARAFGMEVLISTRPGSNDDRADRVPFVELIEQVDYLSLHCPLTEETRHLVNADVLARMKPGALLINTARGALIDSEALVAALEQGEIAGAAVDVLDGEPPKPGETLTSSTLPNLIVTPHNAWGALESRTRLVVQQRENIEAFLSGKPIRVVN